jgi:hypothetical protein
MLMNKWTETILGIVTAMMRRIGVPLANMDMRDALFWALVRDLGPYHPLPTPEDMADFADSDPDATDRARALARDYPNVNTVLCAWAGY